MILSMWKRYFVNFVYFAVAIYFFIQCDLNWMKLSLRARYFRQCCAVVVVVFFILLFSFTCLCFNLVFIILFVKLDWKFYVLVSEMPYSRKTGSIKDRCRHVLSYPFCKCLLFILINLLWSIGKENCTCRFHLYVPSQVAWIKDYFKWTVIKFHSKLTV